MNTIEASETITMEVVESNGNNVPATPSKSRVYLHNPSAIRREMASVYADARNGRIEPQDGTRLIYMLKAVLDAYKDEELARRIETIENTLRTRKQ